MKLLADIKENDLKVRNAVADVMIRNEGTLIGFNPVSAAAKDWFFRNVADEPWQWLGDWLYVDHRMAQPVIDGLGEEGFAVTSENA